MSHGENNPQCPPNGGEYVNGPSCTHITYPPTTIVCNDIVGYTCDPSTGYTPVTTAPPNTVVSEQAEQPVELAFTGSDDIMLAGFGSALLLLGAVLLGVRRRLA